MDISHITNLLSSLGKNQVTIPIVTNGFIETNVDSLYRSIIKDDIFEECDDLMKEIQKNKIGNKNKPAAKHTNTHNVEPIKEVRRVSMQQQYNSVYHNIIHIFACVHDNLVMFETSEDKIITSIKSYLTDLQTYVSNNTDFKSIMIEDRKLSKSLISQEFMKMISYGSLSLYQSIDLSLIKLLIHVSSKYLRKHIVLYNNTNDIIYCEFDYTDEAIEDVLCITKRNDNQYFYDENVSVSVFKEKYINDNKRMITIEDNYKENLKSLSVKDLRQVAQKLCIDIVDTHTNKLYTKGDLRLLIEAKLNTI